jgi:hypothetical protein
VILVCTEYVHLPRWYNYQMIRVKPKDTMRLQQSRVYLALDNPQKWNGNPPDSDARCGLETCAGKSVDADINRQGWGDLWLSE